MAGVRELESMILELRKEARYESQGSFSLNSDRASSQHRKLAEAHPHRWALYVCQAAVALQATRIHLSSSVGADSVDLQLSENVELPPVDQLLWTQRTGCNTALAFLQGAVQWAVASGCTFSLLSRGPEGGWCVDFQGTQVQRRPLPPNQESRWALVLRRPTPALSWFRPTAHANHVSDFLQELRARLAYCPIPVHLDGFTLNPGHPQLTSTLGLLLELESSSPSPLAFTHPKELAASRYLTADGFRCFRPAEALPAAAIDWVGLARLDQPPLPLIREGSHHQMQMGSWQESFGQVRRVYTTETETPYRLSDRQPKLSCRRVLMGGSSGPSEVVFVHYGMNCNPIPLAGTSFSVLWSQGDLDMDPTGLSVVLTAQLQAQLEHLRGRCRQLRDMTG